MSEPKNAILKQYEHLFSLDNVEVEFTDEAVSEIARKAIRRKLGARGLRSLTVENIDGDNVSIRQ